MDKAIGTNNDRDRLKDEIEAINKQEQVSSEFRVSDNRIGSSLPSLDNDARVAELEDKIRKMEKDEIRQNSKLGEEEKLDREVKKREDAVQSNNASTQDDALKMTQSYDEALRENSDRDKAKYEKDFAEAKEMNKEYDEEHTGEKDAKKLEQLKKEIEQARKKYAKSDYDEDKKNRWFKKIFSKRLATVSVDTTLEDYADYMAKLKEFSGYEVEKLKGGNFSDQELNVKIEELVKYFDADEKANLYEARIDVRIMDWEGKIARAGAGWLADGAKKYTQWYRDLNKTKKGMIGKAAIGVALGSVGLGFLWRATGGVIAGETATAYMEGKYREKEKEKTEGKRKEAMTQLEGEEAEKKFTSLMQKLDAEMGAYDESLKREKKEGLKRRMIGLGVGVFIGSGAMGELLKGSAHMIGDTDTFKSVSGYVVNSEIAKTTISFWKDKLENFLGAEKVLVGNLKEGAAHFFGPQEAMAAEIPNKEFPFGNHGIMDVKEIPIKEDLPVLNAEFMQAYSTSIPASEAPIGIGETGDVLEKDGLSVTDVQENPNPHSAGIPAEKIMANHPDAAISGETMGSVATPENIDPEVGKIDLEIKKGSSLEGTIIKHFKLAGMDAHEAGAKAHRMALAYAKEHGLKNGSLNLIHPGAHIEIDADGKIVNISGDSKLGYLHPEAELEKPEVAKEAPVASAEPENHSVEDKTSQAKSAVARAEQLEKDVQGQTEKVHRIKEGLANDHSPQAEELKAQATQIEKLAQEKIAESQQLRGTLEHGDAMPKAEQSGAADVTSGQEIVGSGYGYENFSGDMDNSVKELAEAKEEIFSKYKDGFEDAQGNHIGAGAIKNDADIYRRMEELKEIMTKSNEGGSGGITEISPLTDNEQKQFDILNRYRETFTTAYKKILDSFLDLKSEADADIFDSDASRYLVENKQSRAAQILDGLMKTMTPGEIMESHPSPKPNEKMLDWSVRVMNILFKKKME